MVYEVKCDVMLRNMWMADRQRGHVVVYVTLHANVKNTSLERLNSVDVCF